MCACYIIKIKICVTVFITLNLCSVEKIHLCYKMSHRSGANKMPGPDQNAKITTSVNGNFEVNLHLKEMSFFAFLTL